MHLRGRKGPEIYNPKSNPEHTFFGVFSALGFGGYFGSLLHGFWWPFGSILGPYWEQNGRKTDARNAFRKHIFHGIADAFGISHPRAIRSACFYAGSSSQPTQEENN